MSIKHYFHESLLREYDVRGIVNETLFEADALIIGKIFGTRVLENNERHAAWELSCRHPRGPERAPRCMGSIVFEENERHAAWERSWPAPGATRPPQDHAKTAH